MESNKDINKQYNKENIPKIFPEKSYKTPSKPKISLSNSQTINKDIFLSFKNTGFNEKDGIKTVCQKPKKKQQPQFSKIALTNYLNEKMMFDLYNDNVLGFNNKNQRIIHESGGDNDCDTDEDCRESGIKKCKNDLKKALQKEFGPEFNSSQSDYEWDSSETSY